MVDIQPFPTPEEIREKMQAPPTTDRDYSRTHEWPLAVHEGAHAVVRVALTGTYPDLVYLNDDLWAGPGHGGRNKGPDIEDEDVRGAVAAAGKLAEQITCGYQPDSFAMMISTMDINNEDDAALCEIANLRPDGDHWVEGRYDTAVVCLGERWSEVQAVAHYLVTHRKATGEDLREECLED